jgi:hypothetical protein
MVDVIPASRFSQLQSAFRLSLNPNGRSSSNRPDKVAWKKLLLSRAVVARVAHARADLEIVDLHWLVPLPASRDRRFR